MTKGLCRVASAIHKFVAMSESVVNRGVLVGVDSSAASRAAVAWATRDAVMLNMPLTLVHVVVPVIPTASPVASPDLVGADFFRWQEDQAVRILDEARETVSDPAMTRRPRSCTAWSCTAVRSRILWTCRGMPTWSSSAREEWVPSQPGPAGFRQYRPGTSRALPGRRHPRRSARGSSGCARAGWDRRLAGVVVGGRDRLR